MSESKLHIWKLKVPHQLSPSQIRTFLSFLSHAEIGSYREILDSHSQTNYLLGHAMAHILVKKYVGPRYVPTLVIGERPFISGSDWHLSISHNEHWICVALATDPIGIDVVSIERRVRHADLNVLNWCSPNEIKVYQELPPEQKKVFYFKLWALKEALFKTGVFDFMEDVYKNASFQVKESGSVCLQHPFYSGWFAETHWLSDLDVMGFVLKSDVAIEVICDEVDLADLMGTQAQPQPIQFNS